MRQFMCWLILVGVLVAPVNADPIQPDARYSPLDVVQLVLSAMQQNDTPYPSAGVAQAFAFASPKNKRATGPLWHFEAIVTQPQYAPLINHRTRQLGDPEPDESGMTVPVIVVSDQGQVAGYMWRLSQQTEVPFEGIWMTDAVIPVDLGPQMQGL